ncbi:MAG: bifunctional alpha,alpha-trehalose-phosphate synthase (UDP-forming)/trehalose-phosphatase [Sphingobacteriales bacterium]|nr:MAG: bifunctional alpha,alpha-trehalose-phosphate synthase (UDP-forming)/trehalose-phosphatase [Sphingobacteriales bacterium]
MQKRLFIVSNRLPLTIEKVDNNLVSRPSSGGLVSAINSYLNGQGADTFPYKAWVGTAGCTIDKWDLAGSQRADTDYRFLPVFVADDEYDCYYNGFSNSTLWPLFHYFPSFAEYDSTCFDAYMAVNKHFADLLLKELRAGDTVWIHDYHLLPLAGMLRAKIPELSIGFFLHIPFPSYELFRVIPKKWQREIIRGMLGADLVGFHTESYALHFLNTVVMSMKAEHDGRYVSWDNRQIQVDAFPISIDYNLFNDAYDRLRVITERKNYLQMKGDKKMLFSVDRLDYTKGIFNRLKAFEKFLTVHPELHGKVVFVLVIVPSRDTIAKYNEGKKAIDEYIGNLNSSLGSITWQPIIYHYNHLDFDELIALYTSCDVALITPLRDGMNLVSKEFVASRRDEQGVLILSEMAGSAAELVDALLINPNDIDEIAETIAIALDMNFEEQATRMNALRKRIKRYNVNEWAKDFFEQLDHIKSQQLKFEIKAFDSFAKERLLADYAKAQKRLLLLDYDGTLVPFSKIPANAVPSRELKHVLAQLAAVKKNDVYIISGRDSETLGNWLGELQISLIAEHGAKFRKLDQPWTNEAIAESTAWKDKVEAIMERYVARCPGSFVEPKEFSLAWHYRNSDYSLATRRAKDLYEELVELTLQSPLDVLNGNKVIEVRNKGINKGIAAEKVIQVAEYDFIICIGDDKTDEDMFKVLAKVQNSYTIKVGYQASFAHFNLHTPYLVQELLEAMAMQT